RPVVAAIARDQPDAALVASAVGRAGLWELLAARSDGAADFQVLITAGMSAYGELSTAVSPTLVEALVDLLHEKGYHRVSVAGNRFGPDPWLAEPSYGALAATLGYTGVTPRGAKYTLVDLAHDTAIGDYPTTSVLHGTEIGREWAEAQFHIAVAPNTTHPEFGFSLCLANLFGLLPADDKHDAYRARRDGADVIMDLLDRYPPDFHIVDGIVSSHGAAGSAIGEPLATRCVWACTDPVLLDVLGAIMMGEDPAVSAITAAVLRRRGVPEDYRVDGDLTPHAGWKSPPRFVLNGVRRLRPEGAMHRLFTAAVTEVDDRRFEVIDEWLAKSSKLLVRLVRLARTDPRAEHRLRALLAGAGVADAVDSAWRVIFAKSQVRQRAVSLGFAPADYQAAEYDAVPARLAQNEHLIDALAPNRHGMRWTHLDGAVLFGCDRVLNAPYPEFVRRVEISSVIALMEDYAGGCLAVVSADGRGRPTRQAERNLYLPQPNFLALLGGATIDVCKLESIQYRRHSRKISWRTIFSPNGSAECDDGSVEFSSADNGQRTLIRIRTKQKFVLPQFAQLLGLDAVDGLRDHLVSDAYHRFFSATMDNFEACYEGHEFRIAGLAEERTHGFELGEPLLTLRLRLVYDLMREGLRELWSSDRPEPVDIDEQGFRHFTNDQDATAVPGAAAKIADKVGPYLRDFTAGLRAAAERDARAARPARLGWRR
ncbi:DUF362 domain-containing protein, partial [Amycolatopsis sp. NPDC000673]